jgi:tetratricopeptide (TPR) repeat protein
MAANALTFIRGPNKVAWLDRLEQEHANLQATLSWFIACDDIETCVRVVEILTPFWLTHVHLTIGLRHHNELLARINDELDPSLQAEAFNWAGMIYEFNDRLDQAQTLQNNALDIWLDLPTPPEGAARSLIGLGNIALRHGDVPEAASYYEEALLLCENHNYTYVQTLALGRLGVLAAAQGDPECAIHRYRQSLTLARGSGDIWQISLATGNLGLLLMEEGKYAEAQPLLEETMAHNHALGHRQNMALTLHALGMLELHQGKLDAASARLHESLKLAETLEMPVLIAIAKLGLGRLARLLGNPERARDLFHESLDASRAAGDVRSIADAVEGLAAATIRLGDPQHAASLYASAAAYREQIGTPLTGTYQTEVEQGHATVRASLTTTEFDASWSAGLLLTPDDIV